MHNKWSQWLWSNNIKQEIRLQSPTLDGESILFKMFSKQKPSGKKKKKSTFEQRSKGGNRSRDVPFQESNILSRRNSHCKDSGERLSLASWRENKVHGGGASRSQRICGTLKGAFNFSKKGSPWGFLSRAVR